MSVISFFLIGQVPVESWLVATILSGCSLTHKNVFFRSIRLLVVHVFLSKNCCFIMFLTGKCRLLDVETVFADQVVIH